MMSAELEANYQCVRRVEFIAGGRKRIAWLAATKDGKKVAVRSYAQLKGLQIDESAVLTDLDCERARQGFQVEIADAEGPDMKKIVDTNKDIAHSERYLISLAAEQMLTEQQMMGNTSAVSAVKSIQEGDLLSTNHLIVLPWNSGTFMDWKYVFPTEIHGGKVYLPACDILISCITERCNREINAMSKGKKKSAITVDELITRLKRS